MISMIAKHNSVNSDSDVLKIAVSRDIRHVYLYILPGMSLFFIFSLREASNDIWKHVTRCFCVLQGS